MTNIIIKTHHPFLRKTGQGKNGSPGLLKEPIFSNAISESTTNQIMLPMKEMAQRHTKKQKLFDHHTKKLNDIIASDKRFISILSHDLRNPMGSILVALELLKLKLEPDINRDIESYLNHAFESIKKIIKLLESLTDWALLQNAGRTFNPLKLNLFNLMEEETANYSFQVSQKNLTLNHTLESSVNVSADPDMVKTIFRNLITNAIKYTKPGGEITVSALEKGRFVEITVKDTGIGMTAEVQRRLFKTNEFHSTTGTNNEKGTGFGLLLCKELVEIHGGSFCIESRPERGSKFIFTLPHYI